MKIPKRLKNMVHRMGPIVERNLLVGRRFGAYAGAYAGGDFIFFSMRRIAIGLDKLFRLETEHHRMTRGGKHEIAIYGPFSSVAKGLSVIFFPTSILGALAVGAVGIVVGAAYGLVAAVASEMKRAYQTLRLPILFLVKKSLPALNVEERLIAAGFYQHVIDDLFTGGEFTDPVSLEIFDSPVKTNTGQVLEKATVKTLMQNAAPCPLTREKLKNFSRDKEMWNKLNDLTNDLIKDGPEEVMAQIKSKQGSHYVILGLFVRDHRINAEAKVKAKAVEPKVQPTVVQEALNGLMGYAGILIGFFTSREAPDTSDTSSDALLNDNSPS